MNITKKYVKWTEEEKQAFFSLLEEHYLLEACRIHAANTDRTLVCVLTWFKRNKRKGKIPQEVLDNIPFNCKPWTEEEINALLKLVEQHPNNFREAFRIHAEKTGRDVRTVENYFGQYRKKEEAKTCMITIGRRKMASPNRKNIYARTGGHTTSIKVSKWKRIWAIICE